MERIVITADIDILPREKPESVSQIVDSRTVCVRGGSLGKHWILHYYSIIFVRADCHSHLMIGVNAVVDCHVFEQRKQRQYRHTHRLVFIAYRYVKTEFTTETNLHDMRECLDKTYFFFKRDHLPAVALKNIAENVR